MTTHKDYDSASFEADLEKLERLVKELRATLESPQLREHIDATYRNFSGADHAVVYHEEIMFKVIDCENHILQFADDIRNAG